MRRDRLTRREWALLAVIMALVLCGLAALYLGVTA